MTVQEVPKIQEIPSAEKLRSAVPADNWAIVEEKHFDSRQVKVYSTRPYNLTELLDETVKKFSEKEALIGHLQRFNYQKLSVLVNNLAANFSRGWQVCKGDRVALLLNNSPEFAMALFALARLGAITVPINTRLKATELQFVLNDSGAKFLITDPVIWNELENKVSLLTTLEKVFITGEQIPEGTIPFSPLLMDASPVPSANVGEDETAVIMYTSGTTGKPKGAMITHLGMIHSALNYVQVLGTCPDERTLLTVPLFHVTGLIGQIIHMFVLGGTVVLMESYKTEHMIQLIEKEKITFTFVVPTIYVLMLLNANLDKYNLSAWRLAVYGGAPMSEDTVLKLCAKFPQVRLHNAYGATETSSPATILPHGHHLRKVASVGKPVPVGECKVMGDWQELAANEVGELWIKGPHVVPGYWNNPKANVTEFTDGFWHSGDLAKIDDEGYVYILDRKKDMINRGGEKVFCVEVENVLYSHPKVMEAAVVGVPDVVFGELVKAVVVLKPGETLTVEDVQQFISARLADYKIPKYVDFTDALPRNPGGKVIKAMLK